MSMKEMDDETFMRVMRAVFRKVSEKALKAAIANGPRSRPPERSLVVYPPVDNYMYLDHYEGDEAVCIMHDDKRLTQLIRVPANEIFSRDDLASLGEQKAEELTQHMLEQSQWS